MDSRSHLLDRSAFLHERDSVTNGLRSSSGTCHASNSVNHWKEVVGGGEDALRHKLEEAGVSREDFRHLYEGCAFTVARDEALRWTQFVDGVRGGQYEGESPSVLEKLCSKTDRMTFLPFSSFLSRFVQYGMGKFHEEIGNLRNHRNDVWQMWEEAESLQVQFVSDLVQQLTKLGLRTMLLELNTARMRSELRGENSNQRFRFFSESFYLKKSRFLKLLREYPVLGRLAVSVADRWAVSSRELLSRLAADWNRIEETFFEGRRAGSLISVESGLSDLHNGGRSVARLSFAGGERLIYKPTSLAVDRQFQYLLRELNGLGLRHSHRTFEIMNRGTYGWTEHVDAHTCQSTEEARRFYWRQGSYLSIFHLLRAVDFHRENLIAAGEHPVPIDLESLFHPDVEQFDPEDNAEEQAKSLLRCSVLRSAVLPLNVYSIRGAEKIDYSALGGKAGQAYTHDREIADALKDTMRFVEGEEVTQKSRSQPTLHGSSIEAGAYSEQIVQGFRETYDLLKNHRDALKTSLRKFEDLKVRRLFRPTRQYTLFLKKGRHPDFLGDGLDRDSLLDRLWAKTEERPALRRIVPSELQDLRLGDVPKFETRPESRHLWDSTGHCIADYYDRSALSAVQETLFGFDDDDREQQVSFIRMALDSVSSARRSSRGDGRSANREEAPELSSDAFVDGAVAIGNYLKRNSIRGHDGVLWITKKREKAADRTIQYSLTSTDTTLYRGTTGIALFLAYLGKAAGRSDFEELARDALSTVRARMRASQQADHRPIGAFAGHASYLYLLNHLAALWEEEALTEEALAELPVMQKWISKDEQFDVIGGVAGCALVLLNLYDRTESALALRLADHCATRLSRAAEPAECGGVGWVERSSGDLLLGFSHGAAGIAYALFRVAGYTENKSYRELAQQAIKFDRRAFGGGRRGNPPLSWCHGLSGIALSRLLSAECEANKHDGERSAQMRREAQEGLNALLQRSPMDSPCLCHGSMGNADILLEAGLAWERPAWREAAVRRAGRIAIRVDKLSVNDIQKLTPLPGLMCGLSGIGLGLLRFASPVTVPSVLELASP